MKLRALARGPLNLSEAEYRANLAGINTFFGAVLGFVISGIERLGPIQFGLVLTLIAGIVISILYISASKHRLIYSIYTLAIVAALPWVVKTLVHLPNALPPKLQPTLFVWTLITMFAEFHPRQPADDSAPAPAP